MLVGSQSIKSGQIPFRDPNRFHDQKYMLAITCEVYRNKEGKVHRGLVWKVFQNSTHSALLDTLQEYTGGHWEIVRQPELFMNGPFENFENQIKAMIEHLGMQVTMEIQFNEDRCQVSNEYLRKHGLSHTNEPWMELARFYREGPAITREIYKNKYQRSGKNTDFSQFGYKEVPNSKLDPTDVKYSPEDQKAAETQAEILQSSGAFDK